MFNKKLINALGGTGCVAKALDLNHSTVSAWKRNSIPYKHRHAIIQLASKIGISLDTNVFLGLDTNSNNLTESLKEKDHD